MIDSTGTRGICKSPCLNDGASDRRGEARVDPEDASRECFNVVPLTVCVGTLLLRLHRTEKSLALLHFYYIRMSESSWK